MRLLGFGPSQRSGEGQVITPLPASSYTAMSSPEGIVIGVYYFIFRSSELAACPFAIPVAAISYNFILRSCASCCLVFCSPGAAVITFVGAAEAQRALEATSPFVLFGSVLTLGRYFVHAAIR